MGLALQNTLSSITAALRLNLDAIEIDVRRTADGHLVLMHDAHTRHPATGTAKLKDLPLSEVSKIPLKNGNYIPTVEEVFRLVGSRVPLMLDIKDNNVTDAMLSLLERYPRVQVLFSGRQYDDLKKLHAARPDIPFLLQHHYDPIEIIHTAHNMGAHGICLNMWLMNPWTYRLAKERNLEVYVYTVNHRWLLRFFQMLYPEAILISNYPDRLIAKPRLRQYVRTKKQ